MGTDQTSLKAPASSRSERTTVTAAAGTGKRTDSWKERARVFASGVEAHSP
jgi:hypothetical protein